MLWCFLCLRYLVGESITLRYQALGKLILSIYILRDNKGMIDNQKSLLHILIRCTPDWHSEDMNMSYVFTIWVLGFAIPTLFIVVTSVVTCAKMQQVIQKAHFYSSTKIDILDNLRCIIKRYYTHNTEYWYFIVPSYYQIRCCASYVIQKRSKSFSFGICHEHLLSIVMASLRSASLYSYVYFEKVMNPYFICMFIKSDFIRYYIHLVIQQFTIFFISSSRFIITGIGYSFQHHRAYVVHGTHHLC